MMKNWSKWIVGVIVVVFLYHLWADRYAPTSSSAAVQAYVVHMASRVAGQVSAVYVKDNQMVKKGDPLMQLDPRTYQYALQLAQAGYGQAVQKVAALQAAVQAAEAAVENQQAFVVAAQQHAAEWLPLVKTGVVPRAKGYDVIAEVKTAQANLSRAQYELQKAKQELGGVGQQNSIINQARAELEHAQLALSLTKVVAPMDGYVTNLRLHVGDYAKVGDPLLSFIDNKHWWIEANFKETNMEFIQPGKRVDISVDMYPGVILHGRVQSVGWGVRTNNVISDAAYLPYVDPNNTWVKLAQLFPVRITVDNPDPVYPLRVGATAHATVYAEWNPLNIVPYILRRIQSWLNYLY
jgi:multidrug resistance efflux pump